MLFLRPAYILPAIALVLAGCQPLPHPFEEQHLKGNEVLRAVPDAVGIVVHPILASPAPANAALAKGMIAGLEDAEIPAQTGPGNHLSYRLDGLAETPAPASGPFTLKLLWTLSSHTGRIVGKREQNLVLDTAAWQQGTGGLEAAARAEAAQIAALIQPKQIVERDAQHQIYIAPVSGAPGDGNESLPRALAYMFQRAGIALTDDPKTPGAIIVSGIVTLTPVEPAQQKIAIVWHVIAPGGAEIGKITQENTLPAGMLDGPWAEVSIAVAQAGFDQIEGLVERGGGS